MDGLPMIHDFTNMLTRVLFLGQLVCRFVQAMGSFIHGSIECRFLIPSVPLEIPIIEFHWVFHFWQATDW